jgi:hypothetical protein
VEGINSVRPGSPDKIDVKRGNLGEARIILGKEKMKQGGKRSGDVGDQLGPARKLMIVAASLQFGTCLTEDTKVGTHKREPRQQEGDRERKR